MRTNEDLKFVDRFQCSVAEFAILNRALQQNEVTPDQVYSNLPKGQFQMDRNVVNTCFDHLVEDGHLRKQGDKYTITDDGREDVQKLQPLGLEVPQLILKQGQRPGIQQTAGSSIGGTTQQPRSNVGGSPPGNVGGSQNRPGNR